MLLWVHGKRSANLCRRVAAPAGCFDRALRAFLRRAPLLQSRGLLLRLPSFLFLLLLSLLRIQLQLLFFLCGLHVLPDDAEPRQHEIHLGLEHAVQELRSLSPLQLLDGQMLLSFYE